MNYKTIKILIVVLAAALIAEGLFYYLTQSGRVDWWGFKARQAREIKGIAWGINGAEPTTDLDALGKEWIKIDLYWQEVEKNGWSDFKNQLSAFKGREMIVTVHSNSRAETVCSKKMASAQSSCPPLDIAKYQDFVTQAVQRSAGKVKFWQIEDRALNSGDWWLGNKEQYLKLLQAARLAVKRQNKDNQIILSGIALGNLDVNNSSNQEMQTLEQNLTYIFSQGKDSFDIVDIHLFNTLASAPRRVQWLRDKMKAQNFLKPIWSLETSGPDLTAAEYSEDLQAQEVVKRFLVGFEAGVEKILYFRWQDQNSGQSDPLSATLGLLDAQGRQKLAYTAYRVMEENLAGFKYLKRLNLKENVVGYQLSFDNRQPVFVFWSPQKVRLTLPDEIKDNARAMDYLGNSIAIAKGKLEVDEKPVYILVGLDET